MNQYEVTALIADTFPEADKELRYLSVAGNINKAMSIFSGYTRKMVITHQFKQVRKCMKLIDDIYSHGDIIVKIAVANIFVYSFSLMSLWCNKAEWSEVRALIPARLYSIYVQQVTQSAC